MTPVLEGVAPSILAADFARLGEQVQEVMDAGARVIHVDVMDGHFVPPITMGPLAVEALAGSVHAAGGLIDVHLMIEHPERQIAAFAEAGADCITLHVEATPTCSTRLRPFATPAVAPAWRCARARRSRRSARCSTASISSCA